MGKIHIITVLKDYNYFLLVMKFIKLIVISVKVSTFDAITKNME